MTLPKFNRILFLTFNIFFALSMALTFFIALFNPDLKNTSILLTLIILFLLIIFLFFICFISKKFNTTQLLIISCINFALLLLLQCFFGYFFAVNPSWDISNIYNAASSLSSGATTVLPDYFSVLYPNNIFITILFKIFYDFCNIFNFNLIGASIILNIVTIFLSALISYYLVYKIFNLRIATITSFLFLTTTPFYTYASIFYTDTLTMLFLPLSFLLIYKFKTTNNYIFLSFGGILISIGVGIKTNIILGLIALLIYLILTCNKSIQLIKELSFLIIPFIISSYLITGVCQHYINRPINEAGLPYTHWIMMGLTGVGSYTNSDVLASKSHGPNKNDIKSFNIATIKSRLHSYGFDGYSKFLQRKLKYTWGDGTYFASSLLSRKPKTNYFFHKYIYGSSNSLFLSFAEATHTFLLLLIFISSITLFKSKKYFGHLFNITIFGTFLFLILWETKSRYLVCMLPLFICSASFTIDYIVNIITTKLNYKKL
ncbi:MAG: glycosyltransferase family 39 protein [Clostridium sp.]